MMTSSMGLVGIGLLLFLAAGIVAYVFASWPIWKHVDLVYYPMGAVSVILFFQLTHLERDLLDLQHAYAEHKLYIDTISAERPRTDLYFQSESLLRESFALLQVTFDLGEACEGTFSTETNCVVASRLAGPLSTIDGNFDKIMKETDSFEEKLEAVCELFPSMMRALEEEGVLHAEIISSMRAHYDEGLSRDFSPVDFYEVHAYISGFSEKTDVETDRLYPLLGQEYTLWRDISYEQSEIAETLLEAFENCLRAPRVIRDGTLARWRAAYLEHAGDLDDVQAKIDVIKNAPPDTGPLVIFNLNYWPFLLLAALALKFAKGVSGLRR